MGVQSALDNPRFDLGVCQSHFSQEFLKAKVFLHDGTRSGLDLDGCFDARALAFSHFGFQGGEVFFLSGAASALVVAQAGGIGIELGVGLAWLVGVGK